MMRCSEMKFCRAIVICILFFNTTLSFSQNGVGESSFRSSQIGFQAPTIGLGGYSGSYKETQSSMYLSNPSLLDSSALGKLSLGYSRYIGKTNATELAYALGSREKLTWAIGFKYLGYGKGEAYDVNGNNTGTWSAADFSFKGVASYQVDSTLCIGASLQQAVAQMSQGSLTATLMDIGMYYKKPNSTWSTTLLFKGMGKVYGQNQPSPFDIQLGVSKKPKNAPFRLLFTLYGLNQWDVLTEDEKKLKQTIDPISGEVSTESRWIWGDNAMRHLHTAMEWQFGQLRLYTGFNYERRKTLQIQSSPGLVGMSMGLGFTTKRWEFNYAWSNFNPSNLVHSFGLVFQPFSYH
jgi:hypothetical protein